MTVETITTIMLLSWIVFMITLERFFPYRKGVPIIREGFWVDLVWYTIIQSFLLKILIFDLIILPMDATFNWSALKIVTDWPIWMQVLFFLITHDFYIYLFHRWQHENKTLWRTHEAHHSVKDVDWLAGSRSHSLEILINQTIEFAPIILLGANPVVVPIKALIDAMWGMYIHSNINVKTGRLQFIINGPEMHQWHHADHQIVFFRNYATKFALFDWLFGTGYNPNLKPVRFGLPYAYPKDYFLQHAFAIKRFDVEKIENQSWFKSYYNFRFRVWDWLKAPFTKRVPEIQPIQNNRKKPVKRAEPVGEEIGV